MEPATQSPLLLPANEHKQLVVIDFEYSSANTPGFEFANHFVSFESRAKWVKDLILISIRLNGATITMMKHGLGLAIPVFILRQRINTDLYRHI